MEDKWEYCSLTELGVTFNTLDRSWTIPLSMLVKQTGMQPVQWLLSSRYEPFAVTFENKKRVIYYKRKVVQEKD